MYRHGRRQFYSPEKWPRCGIVSWTGKSCSSTAICSAVHLFPLWHALATLHDSQVVALLHPARRIFASVTPPPCAHTRLFGPCRSCLACVYLAPYLVARASPNVQNRQEPCSHLRVNRAGTCGILRTLRSAVVTHTEGTVHEVTLFGKYTPQLPALFLPANAMLSPGVLTSLRAGVAAFFGVLALFQRPPAPN